MDHPAILYLMSDQMERHRDRYCGCHARKFTQPGLGHEPGMLVLQNAPFQKGEDPKMFHRFYHVFEEGELEAMVSGIPRTKICDSYYDQGNWCIVFEKI